MKKISLLLIIFSQPLFASGEQGTGGTPEPSSTNETIYQLVCTTTTDSTQLENNQHCVLVAVTTDS